MYSFFFNCKCRDATKTLEHEPKKDKDETAEKLEENPDSTVLPDDGNEGNKDSAPEENNKIKDSASKDQKDAASPKPDSTDRSETVKEPDVMATEEEVKPITQSDPCSSDLPKEPTPKDVEESSVSASNTELQSNSANEAGGVAVAVEGSHSKEPIKEEEDITLNSVDKEAGALVISNATEKDDSTGIDFTFCFFTCFHHRKLAYACLLYIRVFDEFKNQLYVVHIGTGFPAM